MNSSVKLLRNISRGLYLFFYSLEFDIEIVISSPSVILGVCVEYDKRLRANWSFFSVPRDLKPVFCDHYLAINGLFGIDFKFSKLRLIRFDSNRRGTLFEKWAANFWRRSLEQRHLCITKKGCFYWFSMYIVR